MNEYDVAHNNETVYEAMIKFINIYNKELKSGDKNGFYIIHGYGASGTGGSIKKTLFDFLDINEGSFEIFKMEKGKSLIKPINKINDYISIIDKYILAFCIVPKPFNKILSSIYKKMKCFSEKKILARINYLCKQGSLETIQKNNLKCYKIKFEE